MALGVARAFTRHKIAVAVAAGLVVALAVTLLVRPWAGTREVADPAPGDRVLQTVNLAMQSDGSLREIRDSLVISRAQTGHAENKAATYEPAAVVNDLPVRVLTSYRTDKSTGTDLGDLTGYSGRVTIDLAVENLTVVPQQLDYDVAGQSRSRTAMVGAPLTVVASAGLAGTNISKIVTAANATGSADTTNGVVSRSQNDAVQVQWATILAPPQLAATATLRLVVDTSDFVLPTIDLSVQPGLITDPSVGTLVNAAFNPKNSGELELQRRTLDVVGDVNTVLVRAGDTITKVRGTLDSTSKTLGTKTVTSLKTDTATIDTSLRSSDANIKALGETLRSSVRSTNSGTISRLAEAVGRLDAVLGDPGTQGSAPQVSGSGCAQEVAAPGSAGSVYATLAQVTAQLDAYASATDACKVELQRAIVVNIGPEQPTEQNCPASAPSVTCSLAGVESTFADIADQLLVDANEAAKKLNPADLSPVTTEMTELITELNEIVADANALLNPDPDTEAELLTALEPTLKAIEDINLDLTAADQSLSEVNGAVAAVNRRALNGRRLVTEADQQNEELARQLCALVSDVPQPNTLSAEQVADLRAFLVSEPCEAGDPPLPPQTRMSELLDSVGDDFDDIANQTSTTDPVENGVVDELGELGDDLDNAAEAVLDADTAVRTSDRVIKTEMTKVRNAVDEASERLARIKRDTDNVQKAYTTAKNALNVAIGKAGSKANAAADQAVKDEIKRIGTSAQASNDDLEEAFERSVAGLDNAADRIRRDGRRAVRAQRDDLDDTQQQAEKILSDSAKQALSSVSTDVGNATRDLDATRTLLNKDLTNILLDLGTPGVRGTGVLGLLATSASAAGSADYQLALASEKVSGYGSVRDQDVNGILLRQAQADAALQREADLPAFARDMPATTAHRTVYLFQLAGGR